jgi:diphosphomevalonate decarboxylase
MNEAVAVAHPNIALAKYWGKRAGEGNFPAVPSLSVTLAGLSTRTRVAFQSELREDRFELDGEKDEGERRARVTALLDRVRRAAGLSERAEVVSRNDFPTASGLASSASGFAALALAAVRAAGLDWDASRVSDLARRSSASAARSVFGGWVELDATEADVLAARQLAPPEHVDWRVLVAVTSEGKKALGSTEGMRATAADSPYYEAWLTLAPRLAREQRQALLARDFERFGALAEQSAFAMHACAIAAGVVYWSGATLEALGAVRALRTRGTPAFATVDAGPHVKALVRGEDAALAGTWLRAVPGVIRVIESSAGGGARVGTCQEGP